MRIAYGTLDNLMSPESEETPSLPSLLIRDAHIWTENRTIRGSILIEKEVPKNLYPHEARNRSPFADKASLLLRYLLDKPDHAGRVLEIPYGVVDKIAKQGNYRIWRARGSSRRIHHCVGYAEYATAY